MGYHTTIICMSARPKDRPMKNKDWETESEIISEVESHSDINNLSDENDPLKEVSLTHKNWIIEVEGRGDDQEDLWRCRYLNGRYEVIYPEWPEYKKIGVKTFYQPVVIDKSTGDYIPQELYDNEFFPDRKTLKTFMRENLYNKGTYKIRKYTEKDKPQYVLIDSKGRRIS